MREHENRHDTQSHYKSKIEERRQFLKLAAAGMPMAITLRASATEALISQLTCCTTVLNSFGVLVDEDGAAWLNVGESESDWNTGSSRYIRKFKKNADWNFSSGTVSADFRPSGCSAGSGDDDDCSLSEEYNWYSFSAGDEIYPGNFYTGSGWNYSGKEGMYVELSRIYADAYGNSGSWQGISCMVSVFTYISLN
jgi:hypothetical protein